MKFKDYALSKSVTICFISISLLFIAALMLFSKINLSVIIIFQTFFIIVVLAWLITSWKVDNNKTARLHKIISELPAAYLAGEVIPSPSNSYEKKYYDIMKAVSRSAIGEVEKAVNEKNDYCEFVESWIHEIKTPLTACSLILSNGGDKSKLKHELKCADNLTEIIMYYARMRTAQKDTQIKNFSVASVINDAVKDQMELLIAAKISINITGDFSVCSDCKSLGFIIKQLLINCAKYCPGCRIEIAAANGVISVCDNGIGIPDYELPRVTDRGFTGSSVRNKGRSTGMGLYIVSQLCSRLDISLKIESVQNEYTCVRLSFDSLTKL